MILRTATTLGLLALSLATDSPALAQPEAPAPTLQIQPNTPTPATPEEPAQSVKNEAAEPPLVVVPARTAEPPVAAVPAKQEEPPAPALPPMPPVAPVLPPMPPMAPVAPVAPVQPVAPQVPHVEVAPGVPVEEEWHIAIVPLGGCYPPAPAQPGAPDIRYYREVYESIPFSRAEFEANPSYRHDATLEILFGCMRPTTIVRGPANVGSSQYYPIQSPPVVSPQPWFGFGNYLPGLTPWYRFGTRGYFNRNYGPLYP